MCVRGGDTPRRLIFQKGPEPPPRSGLWKDTPPNLPLQAVAVPLVTHRSCIILIYLFIEQIFIECLLQAVPSLQPTGALKTWPAPSCEAQGSGKASLTPLPAPGLGEGAPLLFWVWLPQPLLRKQLAKGRNNLLRTEPPKGGCYRELPSPELETGSRGC